MKGCKFIIYSLCKLESAKNTNLFSRLNHADEEEKEKNPTVITFN